MHTLVANPRKLDPNPISGDGIVRIVTTSWDDGVVEDLKVAELLEAHTMSGTFYVPVAGRFQSPALSRGELRDMAAQGFEIGAHGFFHRILPECGPGDLTLEIAGSKRVLEEILGKKVRMFAYPRGRHSADVLFKVKKSGFTGARTTRVLARGFAFDSFRMPTSLQVYPHYRVAYLRNVLREAELTRTREFMSHFRHLAHWTELGKSLFDQVMQQGGVWHLYGHSWEIEELRLWGELQEMFEYVSGREGVLYMTNGEVVDYLAPPSMPSDLVPPFRIHESSVNP